jgi:hypothetical protein
MLTVQSLDGQFEKIAKSIKLQSTLVKSMHKADIQPLHTGSSLKPSDQSYSYDVSRSQDRLSKLEDRRILIN